MTESPVSATCSRCKEEKPSEAFAKFSRAKNGLQSYCRACKSAYDREWTINNREYLTHFRRLARYGVTQEDTLRMLTEQGGACAICRRPFKNGKFTVDHNHKTAEVRALLCHACNTGLGKFGDSREGLQRAITYLDTYDRRN